MTTTSTARRAPFFRTTLCAAACMLSFASCGQLAQGAGHLIAGGAAVAATAATAVALKCIAVGKAVYTVTGVVATADWVRSVTFHAPSKRMKLTGPKGETVWIDVRTEEAESIVQNGEVMLKLDDGAIVKFDVEVAR